MYGSGLEHRRDSTRLFRRYKGFAAEPAAKRPLNPEQKPANRPRASMTRDIARQDHWTSRYARAIGAGMRYKHPLKRILHENCSLWDRESTHRDVRKAFHGALECGTAAPGAEVYSSGVEDRVVSHICDFTMATRALGYPARRCRSTCR